MKILEKAVCAATVVAGQPVYFDAADELVTFAVFATADSGERFAGIAAQDAAVGEECYFVPPGGEATILVPDGDTFKGGNLIYVCKTDGGAVANGTYNNSAEGDTHDIIARVNPVRALDGTLRSAVGSALNPTYITVAVLPGLPV